MDQHPGMSHRFSDIVFTSGVKAAQERYGTRARNEKFRAGAGANETLGPGEIAFITARDSFYMATVGESGWPYLQHRGGPAGFLRVLGPRQLAYADFRGNLQYVSVGNLARDDRAALFLMDYANRRRLKILGHVRAVDVADPDPRVERIMQIEIEAFEWNCSQHITPRFTRQEWEGITAS